VTLIAPMVSEKLKSLFTTIANEFGNEVLQRINNNILEYQLEEYGRNSFTKTLLHRVQPKDLKDFYQPLFVAKYGSRHSSTTSDWGIFKRIPTSSISRLFAGKRHITLIGNAGSGKSTIVKHLFLNSIDSNFRIPIKVELRYLNDYESSLIDFIKDKIFKLSKLARNDRIIERLMSSGDFVFFLDGYDEIASIKKESLTKEIDDLARLYNKNFYLLTSRPHTEIDLLPLFYNFEVCELSGEEINSFIAKQIPAEETELCRKMIEAVNSKENIAYKTFLSNPLLLSMFILTFQSYSSIPQKKSVFYSQVFDALFSVHDSMSKLAFVREKQSGLAKEQIVEVLKLYSFISYFDEKTVFSELYLNEKLSFIKSKKSDLQFDNQKLIQDLQIAIGILNKEGTDYTFPHRSLQEYFAVTYIASLNEENKRVVYQKIINKLTSKGSNSQSTRDNFHLLLSELDEKSVIKHALIPYFEKYISQIDLDKCDYKEVLEKFLILHRVYEAFYLILDSEDTLRAHEYFDERFSTYRSDDSIGEPDKNDRLHKVEKRRKKLALEEIRPFLLNFIPKIVDKKIQLSQYLVHESNVDSDIVSLI
jgi:predicted NACHT family NTPase